ncbi:MAG: hypothetical protein K2N27_03580 [Ruminococcus sp.]|nr:hypothetical protein [Ruminococcus sp.]
MCKIVTDTPTSVKVMFYSAENGCKSGFVGLAVDAIKTADKPVKYGKNNKYSYTDKPKHIGQGFERIVNIYCALSD